MTDVATVASNPVTATAASALAATGGGQTVEWVANGILHLNMPEAVALYAAAALTPIVHAIYRKWLMKLGDNTDATPAPAGAN